MRSLPLHMFMSAILLLMASTGTDEMAARRRSSVRMATARVTIIQAERIVPALKASEPQKQDRQVRKREEKPMIEFY